MASTTVLSEKCNTTYERGCNSSQSAQPPYYLSPAPEPSGWGWDRDRDWDQPAFSYSGSTNKYYELIIIGSVAGIALFVILIVLYFLRRKILALSSRTLSVLGRTLLKVGKTILVLSRRTLLVLGRMLLELGETLIVPSRRTLIVVKRKITKEQGNQNENIEAFFKAHDLLTPRQYSLAEIKMMTNSFKDKIGQGGFGNVYKGKLLDGKHVAVKLLNDSKSNGEDFINEVSSISRTSHVNIVPLLGFSYKPKRVLIYEFMPNGSLDKLIYNNGTHSHLGWKMLYEIAIGIARGLEYLHRGCNTRILHFDIKPHNILLDENFCPKISDFGLAKLGKSDQSNVSTLAGPRGTLGYIAPEVCSNHFGRVSYKSDVYSYGMMVLEMVGGRRNVDPHASQTSKIYFPHYVFKRIVAGEDLHLGEFSSGEEEEIAKKMVIVSLWCIQTNSSDRPSMSGVLEMLQGALHSLLFPPNPFVDSPTASP